MHSIPTLGVPPRVRSRFLMEGRRGLLQEGGRGEEERESMREEWVGWKEMERSRQMGGGERL